MKYKLTDLTWDKNEYNALKKCIKKNTFTMGKEVKLFERNFAKKFNSKFSIMVNSGSSANLIGFHAMKLLKFQNSEDKIKVAVPAVSWSTTYFPLQQLGFELVFVDVDIKNFNDSNEVLEKLKVF